MVRKQYAQRLRRRDMYDEFLGRSALFLKRIERRDLIGQRNTLIGQMNNGIRSSRVTRRGHNLEDIHGFGLHAKSGRNKSTTRIMYNTAIKERLDGCFGGQ
jgi:hypothetical protein